MPRRLSAWPCRASTGTTSWWWRRSTSTRTRRRSCLHPSPWPRSRCSTRPPPSAPRRKPPWRMTLMANPTLLRWRWTRRRRHWWQTPRAPSHPCPRLPPPLPCRPTTTATRTWSSSPTTDARIPKHQQRRQVPWWCRPSQARWSLLIRWPSTCASTSSTPDGRHKGKQCWPKSGTPLRLPTMRSVATLSVLPAAALTCLGAHRRRSARWFQHRCRRPKYQAATAQLSGMAL
mmetsp:Transcript_10864/g.32565  ORF Transcript_10864/g.32565 Transcript_10864/m.32565 type:complete len:231 (+) Transcript_10864:463-1155(+)